MDKILEVEMVFSSLSFLCVFLPVTLLLERLMPTTRTKNAVLVVASLLFYAYGEPTLVLLMIVSTLFNYAFGRLVGGSDGTARRAWLAVAVVVNLGMLGVFKYAGMLVSTVNALLGLSLPVPDIPLPLGISFYTFQALSYVIDVYRGDVEPQRNYTRILLYVSFFPQLIAGPIVKYHDIDEEMANRHAGMEEAAMGLRRFSFGLAKKVLVANVMASTADTLLALSPAEFAAPSAWLAAFAYLMQIYFDFSGYSDMAIGLGLCFGFHFKENFDHPYSSTSVKEFWRRWHMSLSTWLKEYLYIPLGGNRKGRGRAMLNRIIVFFVCGLWHGANWTFVVWGLLHGVMLLVEDVVDVRRLPRALGHVLTMLFVMLTFVIFRCDTLQQGVGVIGTMFGGWRMDAASMIPFFEQLTPLFIVTAIAAVVLAGSTPVRVRAWLDGRDAGQSLVAARASYAIAFLLLALCMISLSSGTYNPFIYFRF